MRHLDESVIELIDLMLLDVNPLQNVCRGVIDGSLETWYAPSP